MSITWNGVSSDTIGVIVERIPNRHVPTRRFSPQQVAGRNGNILLVDKAFPNVEQEYEVYLSAEAQGLPSVARACAEWLMGPDGYCRLEDSYDTTVYREAFLMGGFDIENILNKFGRCTITFSCKPQKYLLTGDTPIEIPAGTTTTYTGDVVQFDVITGASITSLSATITPTQDLHGYSSPWPAGGGKNVMPNVGNSTTFQDVTITYNSDDSTYTLNGSTTAAGNIPLASISPTLMKWVVGNGYTLSCRVVSGSFTLGEGTGITYAVAMFDSSSSSYIRGNTRPTESELDGYTCTGNAFSSTGNYQLMLQCWRVGTVFNNLKIRIQLEAGSSATSWTPYANICPISGLTGLSLYRTGKNLFLVLIGGDINTQPRERMQLKPMGLAQMLIYTQGYLIQIIHGVLIITLLAIQQRPHK